VLVIVVVATVVVLAVDHYDFQAPSLFW